MINCVEFVVFFIKFILVIKIDIYIIINFIKKKLYMFGKYMNVYLIYMIILGWLCFVNVLLFFLIK